MEVSVAMVARNPFGRSVIGQGHYKAIAGRQTDWYKESLLEDPRR